MPRRRLLAICTCALLLIAIASATTGAARAAAPGTSERRAERRLAAIRHDPAELHAFLAAMPKGGDLHNHLSGAVPTETLIGYAVQDGLCIDIASLAAMPAPPPA